MAVRKRCNKCSTVVIIEAVTCSPCNAKDIEARAHALAKQVFGLCADIGDVIEQPEASGDAWNKLESVIRLALEDVSE